MRIVIDLQGAQSDSRYRGIGRYSLAHAQSMVKNGGDHEFIIVLNSMLPEAIEVLRAAFDGLLPQENIRVWHAHAPVYAIESTNNWRRHTAELIREAFLASLQPDIVHITSLMEGFGDNSVHSVGLLPFHLPTAVTFYDLIPLIQSEVYLKPNPIYEMFYIEKIENLRRADLYLAISESSRLEAIKYLNAGQEQAVNIATAADDIFKPINISPVDKKTVLDKFGLTRPFVMYSGATDERKNHLRLIKAFSLLSITLRNKYQLAIVGWIPETTREHFEEYANSCGLNAKDFVITGTVTDGEMVQIYNLCDLFVFPSWHEGFGLPALEAMSCGAPTIGSNNTSLPEVIGRADALFDPFDENSIAQKITEVLTNESFRKDLAQHGLKQAKKFTWDNTAKKTITAFEDWYAKQCQKSIYAKKQEAALSSSSWLIDNIAKLAKSPDNVQDWLETARLITQNYPETTEKQLLVDISELMQRDSKSGIQRVVRSILIELLLNPPKGFRVEPVYANSNQEGFRYAREFTMRFLNCPDQVLWDEPIDVKNGDIFLGLDLQHHVVSRQAEYYAHLRHIGCQVYFVVYDLLPCLMPHCFGNGASALHKSWLEILANNDGVICISRAVADEMAEWLTVFGSRRFRPFKLGWFHLGADMAGSVPSVGLPSNVDYVMSVLDSRVTFLMVGTIEPRKGQKQTLEAFDLLWNQQIDVNLVIIGKQGWLIDELIEKIRGHSELNRRLFWLEGISDEYLEKVYAASTCLIAASEGEGFGLPLIEAAQYKLPIIARDIPVFREVAGDYAFYFSGLEAELLADAVRDWLALDKIGQVPQSDAMPWLTWKQSTQNLLDVMLSNQWYQQWMPDVVYRFWGGDLRLGTQVGKNTGHDISTTGQAGALIFGPYISLVAGKYLVTIRGTVRENGLAGAHMDVATDKATVILGHSVLNNPDEFGNFVSLVVSLDKPCTDFEVRVWVSEYADLQISMIEIAPWQDEPEIGNADSQQATIVGNNQIEKNAKTAALASTEVNKSAKLSNVSQPPAPKNRKNKKTQHNKRS